MTTQADALRMAEQLEEDANALEACELVHDAKYLNQAAAMLREHAEGVEEWQKMTEEARRIQARHLDHHDGDLYHAMQSLCVKFGYRDTAPLTAALSGREEGK